jgi:hypothetical protein
MATAKSLRAIAYALLALVLGGLPVSSFAQEGDVSDAGAVSDPYSVPGVTAEPVDKALGGAQWTLAGYFTDQTGLRGIFLSGTFATGNFPNCTNYTVPQWTMTVTRDGALFVAYSSNVWNNVVYNPDGTPRCGFSFSATPRGYEVLTPGTYTFRMSQPAFGADVVKTVVVPACAAPISMYRTRNDQYTDNFYTVSPSQRDISISQYGYYNAGIPFRVSRTNQAAQPFHRYFKGAPQIEHFYTNNASEDQAVVGYGYVLEGNEGNIFPSQLAGTVPLYRLAKFDGATGDLQHVYTISTGEVSMYQSQNWGLDGVQGYVCAP